MVAVRRPSLELVVRDRTPDGIVASSLIARLPTPDRVAHTVEFARKNQAPKPQRENFYREERGFFGSRLVFDAASYELQVQHYKKTLTEEDITGGTTKEIVFNICKVLSEVLERVEAQDYEELFEESGHSEAIFTKAKDALLSVVELGSFQRPATTVEGEGRQRRRLPRSVVMRLLERLNRVIHVSKLISSANKVGDGAARAQLSIGYKAKTADLQLFVSELMRVMRK